jgi:hypothetical protein
VVQQAVGALDGVLRSIKTQLEPEEAKELKKLRKRWLNSHSAPHKRVIKHIFSTGILVSQRP